MDILVLENLVVDHGGPPRFCSFSGLPNLDPGVIAPGRAVSNKVDAQQDMQPTRFDLRETKLESWVRESVEANGAEAFFKRYYSRPTLAALDALCSAANTLDRSVIRNIKG